MTKIKLKFCQNNRCSSDPNKVVIAENWSRDSSSWTLNLFKKHPPPVQLPKFIWEKLMKLFWLHATKGGCLQTMLQAEWSPITSPQSMGVFKWHESHQAAQLRHNTFIIYIFVLTEAALTCIVLSFVALVTLGYVTLCYITLLRFTLCCVRIL